MEIALFVVVVSVLIGARVALGMCSRDGASDDGEARDAADRLFGDKPRELY
jgi:hypothetical protein